MQEQKKEQPDSGHATSLSGKGAAQVALALTGVAGKTRMGAAAIMAMVAGLGMAFGMRALKAPRKSKTRTPMMVTSPPEEIAAWNRAVEARKPSPPSKLHRKPRGDSGQHPKFAKVRAHKQHQHRLRDDHGAFTLIGRRYELEGVHPTSRESVLTGWVDGDNFGYTVQRKWLAGISAQRGY